MTRISVYVLDNYYPLTTGELDDTEKRMHVLIATFSWVGFEFSFFLTAEEKSRLQLLGFGS
jgi:hypothetical protein